MKLFAEMTQGGSACGRCGFAGGAAAGRDRTARTASPTGTDLFAVEAVVAAAAGCFASRSRLL